MITYFLSPYTSNKLWEIYASGGYALGTGCKGFGSFIKKNVQGVCVKGTTTHGHILEFENDSDYTFFLLKWS